MSLWGFPFLFLFFYWAGNILCAVGEGVCAAQRLYCESSLRSVSTMLTLPGRAGRPVSARMGLRMAETGALTRVNGYSCFVTRSLWFPFDFFLKCWYYWNGESSLQCFPDGDERDGALSANAAAEAPLPCFCYLTGYFCSGFPTEA